MTAQRFETLDAMRGVAALAVVAYHLGGMLGTGKVGLFGVPHGYLAVDFFFALSGLVLARAYRQRLDAGWGVVAFTKMRVVRFYPLYLLGTVLGMFVTIWPMIRGYVAWRSMTTTAIAVATSLVMLPGPPVVAPSRLMTFNPPAWSLAFELGINILLVVFWRFLNPRALAVVLLMSGPVLAIECLTHGSMDMGADWATAALGLDRTLFSFALGLCLARMLPRRRVTSVGVAVLPLLLLAAAFLPGAEAGAAYDLACVFLLFPALLLWGASIDPTMKGPFRFLGAISFAVYALHYSLIGLVRLVMAHVPFAWMTTPRAIELLTFPLLIAAAWLADLYYDRPVRAWLRASVGTPRSHAL